jgi:hypothetical protein
VPKFFSCLLIAALFEWRSLARLERSLSSREPIFCIDAWRTARASFISRSLVIGEVDVVGDVVGDVCVEDAPAPLLEDSAVIDILDKMGTGPGFWYLE